MAPPPLPLANQAHVFGPLNTTAAALMARLSAAGVDNILDYPFGDAMASHGGKGTLLAFTHFALDTGHLSGALCPSHRHSHVERYTRCP